MLQVLSIIIMRMNAWWHALLVYGVIKLTIHVRFVSHNVQAVLIITQILAIHVLHIMELDISFNMELQYALHHALMANTRILLNINVDYAISIVQLVTAPAHTA